MRLPNQARPISRDQRWRVNESIVGVYPSSCSLGKKIECGIELVGELAGLATCPEDVPGCLAALAGIIPFVLRCEPCLGDKLLNPVCGFVEDLIRAGINTPPIPQLAIICQGHGGCCSA